MNKLNDRCILKAHADQENRTAERTYELSSCNQTKRKLYDVLNTLYKATFA